MKQNNLVTLLLVIIFSAAGFFGGIKYQQSKNPTFGNRFNQIDRANNPPNGRGVRGGGMTNGEIITADDKSITVKMIDGSSKVVLLSTNTTINKSADGTINDLKAGGKVAVFGSTNSDGSLTAASIQLNPVIRGGTPAAIIR